MDGVETTAASQQQPARGRTPLREKRLMVSAAVAVSLLAVVTLAGRGHKDAAPFSIADVSPSAHLSVVSAAQAQQRIDLLAGVHRLNAVIGQGDVIVGQLQFATPSGPRKPGQYAVFVIDNDSHELVSGIWGVSPGSDVVRSGFASQYAALARAHSWLQPLAGAHQTAISFTPGTASPVTFEATLPAGSLTVTNPSTQLTVVLAFFAVDGHLYWVTRVPA